MANNHRYSGPIYLKTGLLFANGFIRVVHGGRGDYVEFMHDQVCEDSLVRQMEPHYYYIEYRTKDSQNAKVYYQMNKVDYADYIPGMFYISPVSLKDFEVYGWR